MKLDSKQIKKERKQGEVQTSRESKRIRNRLKGMWEIKKRWRKNPYTIFLKLIQLSRPLQSDRKGEPPLVCPAFIFAAQPLMNYQTHPVTVTTAAVRLALTPLLNKPKLIQLQAHANATYCISMSQS